MRPAERFLIGPTAFGKMFRKSRWWAGRVMREWWKDQEAGGPILVHRRRSGHMTTTLAAIEQHMPRRKDEVLERRLRSMEIDLARAFTRIAELERALGRKR